jgi:integrase
VRHTPKRLTDLTIERFPAAAEGTRDEHLDAAVPGLKLRVTDTGAKSWSLLYRHRGRLRRLTLGTFPRVTTKAAHDLARAAFRQLTAGTDPAEAKRQAREQADEEKELTVAAAVTRWLEQEISQRRPSTQAEWHRIMDRDVLPRLGKRPLASITKRDVLALVDKIVERGAGVHANHTLMRLRRFFNWAIEKDLLAVSPAAGVKPPTIERSRDRVLTDDELAAFWHATDKLRDPYGALFRFLALTGQRRDECGELRWSEVDLDGRVWVIPSHRFKSDREHRVSLSDAALDVLRAIPRIAGSDLVFSNNGRTAVSSFSRAMDDARQLMTEELGTVPERLTLHDLRRTITSGLARLGIAPHIADKILGHTVGAIGPVASIYQRFQFADERAAALECWGRFVLLLAAPTPTAAIALRDCLALVGVRPSDRGIVVLIEKLAPTKPGKVVKLA